MTINTEIRSWSECTCFMAYPELDLKSITKTTPWGMAFAGMTPDPDTERCLIPMSRSPRKLPAEDLWLSAVRNAVGYASDNGWTIVSSYGTIGWEYTSWYAARRNLPLWMVLPAKPIDKFSAECESLIDRFKLNLTLTTFVMPLIDGKVTKNDGQIIRDMLTAMLSKHRLPVYVRPKGNWMSILIDSRKYDNRFLAVRPFRYIEPWRKDDSWTQNISNQNLENALIHWTKGAYGPWFGEVDADYFEAITLSESGNPRDGLATLVFIAMSGIVRGAGRMIRKGEPVISFSELNPAELLNQIEYKSYLKRWNYEPYGIAISTEVLKRLGAKKVIYGSKELYEQLTPDQRPYYQFDGRNETPNQPASGWESESEWRLTGDLDLTSIMEEVTLITPFEYEAAALRESLPYRICSLERGTA
ncbi:MAG: hypothetical protein HQ568_00120 [Calditrichaeota bacterium]|nr:hypothetical protein [Calditrichota bacterium]